MMVHVHYNFSLVIGSVVIALLICYFAVSIEQLLFKNLRQEFRKYVLICSGLVLGAAVWCMHFVGMLACHLPANYHFDYLLTFFSYVIAFLAATFAIWLNNQSHLSLLRLLLGSILMGLGISGMHYTGMMGLLIDGHEPYYDLILVIFSVVIAICGSGVAFWLSNKYKFIPKHREVLKIFISLMIALAIIGMHYTGMAAISWQPVGTPVDLSGIYTSEQGILLFSVIFVTSLVLLAAFCVAMMEQRLEERSKQLFKLNQKLAHQAFLDSLTQLPNRSFLTEYADSLFLNYQHNHEQLAFIYIDVDQFKAMNDSFGPYMGDQLLLTLTQRLQQNLASHEKLFRLGGDEFLLVVEHTHIKPILQLTEHLLHQIQQPFLINQQQINISASMGIAMFPEHGQNLQDLLMNAEAAMLSAKFKGRNTYTIYVYSVEQQEVRRKNKLINDLYRAVEEQQFILYYQPKFTALDYRVCGVEALIRWKHPNLGLLSPNMFIHGAEQTGLIIQIGYWVLEQACQQIQSWEKQGRDFFPIAVNLSAIQFEHQHLFSTLERLFEQYKINPSHLMLEVTESIAMHEIDNSIKCFERLRRMGVKLSIDDFGTGHSSFLYLKKLPVDELKIDRGFLLDLKPDSKDEIILESIVSLAIKLGLIVTAEGVEYPQQANILRKLGCQQLQGYLLGMPMPIQQLEKMILPKNGSLDSSL